MTEVDYENNQKEQKLKSVKNGLLKLIKEINDEKNVNWVLYKDIHDSMQVFNPDLD